MKRTNPLEQHHFLHYFDFRFEKDEQINKK
jgi:hypothetical protein